MAGRSKSAAEAPRDRKIAASGPAAMSRVLRLFDILAREPGGLTLSQASEALDTPKSTILASLRALTTDGFLLADGPAYRLGPAAFRLAATILSSSGGADNVRYYLRELARSTRESVGYAIADWEIGQAIYIDAVNSTQPVHYAMRAGIRAPLYASAAGRVLLAFARETQRSTYFMRAKLRPLTDKTKTDLADINAHLEEVRQLGYCASFGEMLKDTAAIAVPVFNAAGEVTGALMIAAPLDRMRANFDTLLGEVRRTGMMASGLVPPMSAVAPVSDAPAKT